MANVQIEIGTFVVMTLTGEIKVLGENLSYCIFIHHTSQVRLNLDALILREG
jgi:hypothetical protein